MAMETSELIRHLVTANRILAREDVADAYGHVSVRHPERPDRFLMSCSHSPELVKAEDILEYDLDCNPVDPTSLPLYIERPIHGALYKHRPDIHAVVHSHAMEVIPFGLTGVKLRPVLHVAAPIGAEIPVWDIRDKFGDTNMLVTTMEQGHDLACCLGHGRAALMRGHGSTVAADNLFEAVRCAVFLKTNAKIQMLAMQMGTVRYLSPGETEMAHYPCGPDSRLWEYWAARCGPID